MSGTHGARSRRVGAFALVAGAVVLVVGTGLAAPASAGKPGGGGGGTPISTGGVVAFGDGTSTANRGTYRMSPTGAGLGLLSTRIYPMDVSRGNGPVTVLVNGTPGQDIWVMHADGTGTPVQLRTGSSQSPRISLDGAHVAYVALVSEG